MTRFMLALCLGVLLGGASLAESQAPKHRLTAQGTRFFLEEIGTNRKRPFDVWVTRLANACFDTRYTDLIIEQLDDYLRYGINTIVVGIQGGNLQTFSNPLYPKTYNLDGSLDLNSIVWGNLRRLLAEADKRGMVVMVQFWYFLRHKQVPTDAAALLCTTNAAKWLKATGHQNIMLDVVNEFTHPVYYSRPLFNTANGALQIIHAAKTELPGVLVGLSPKGGLAAPEGTITVGPSQVPVKADIIIGHNAISNPSSPGSYMFNRAPSNPLSMPYVNNEFNSQLGSEHYSANNPRTGRFSYGHFTPAIVALYLRDLQTLRVTYNGYGNVFSSHQQFVPPNDPIPDPRVGPEGTQPQATAGTAEPSMHWLFSAIAAMRKFGSLETFHDFEANLATGFLLDGPGTWAIAPTFDGRRLEQTDANATLAWTRMVPDSADVDIACEAGFPTTPSTGTIGLLYGGADPSGPNYRLRITQNRVTLDQVGGPMTPQSAVAVKNLIDQYRFVRISGRVMVYMNDRLLFNVADNGAVTGHNLLLTTESTDAWFDNLRAGPLRVTDFDLGSSGSWVPQTASAWTVASQVWRATVTSGVDYAVLDQRFEDLVFHADLNLANAANASIAFRVQDATKPGGESYRASVSAQGGVTLFRVSAGGVATTLGTATATINRAAVNVRVSVEASRVRIDLDGNPVLDATDPAPALDGGALAIGAHAGTTDFDNLKIEGGPRRYPVSTITNTTGPAIPRGLTIYFNDPDGLWDLRAITLEADFGGGYFDVTKAMISPLFLPLLPGDGKGIGFSLNTRINIGRQTVWLRATATDRDGNRDQVIARFN